MAQPTLLDGPLIVRGDLRVQGRISDTGGADFTVKSFGARGDGVTDDLVAIQATIDACSAAGGGSVLVPPGTYLISAELLMKSNVTLCGAGWTSILKIMDGSTQRMAIYVLGVSRVGLRDFKIDGNELNRTPENPYAAGVFISNDGATNATDITIDHLEITKAGNGVEGYQPQRLWVQNCWIHDTGTAAWGDGGGIAISGRSPTDLARDIHIVGNTIENISEIGIGPTWCDRVDVVGNTLNGSNGAARVGSSDAAFSCNGSSNVRVLGNHMENFSQGGIFIRDLGNAVTWRAATNVTVTGNTLKGMLESTALQIRGHATAIARGITVQGNVFESNGIYGIILLGMCEDITIGGNTFRNNCTELEPHFSNYDIGVPTTGAIGPTKRVTIQGNVHSSDNGNLGTCLFINEANAEAFSIQGNIWTGQTNDGLFLAGINHRVGLNYSATGRGNGIGPTRAIQTRTTAYTLTLDDNIVFANATSAGFTVTLPTAVGQTGREYIVKKTDASANVVTIDPNGAETIEGAATYDLTAQWQGVVLVSNGVGWLIVSEVA